MTNATKIALVTGGSRGLGRNTAISLAHRGVDVILTYRTQAGEADDVVREIEALGRKAAALQLDVGEAAQFDGFAATVRDTLERVFGRQSFDFLVNNAGIGIYVPFAETTEAMFDQLAAIHLKGPFFLTQKLLPLIADGGAIVNLSSGLARFTWPGFSAYAAMKGGIEVLTRYMAKELGARGIRANTVAPGAIETDFGGGMVRDNEDSNRAVAAATALGRAGLPDDIGPMIAALLGEENRWVNGQRIEVSGGVNL
ncbi:SDR family NAD(P)-dependent oxidoreductase [Aquabacter spiritensis]|uniref:NAD(P)-dependent dehydrogenase (Short-subunit alcohol dehydrogenase family) n=1 Tax=Aquabacter spiritensis TaxID=933073 RepID=A0A4R3M0G7_9HYPH|nr:SDR family oxidoreductase [Aquabacter spiritensis]TCT04575.1 NAD(P)-dependent dehydrogenase (short-subunit alcohol dehydrogenase family) [Aquabacter spiritensis]